MNTTDVSGDGVDEAIHALLKALRAEGVDPIEDGFAGIPGLTLDQRLLFAAALKHAVRAEPEPQGAVNDTSVPAAEAQLKPRVEDSELVHAISAEPVAALEDTTPTQLDEPGTPTAAAVAEPSVPAPPVADEVLVPEVDPLVGSAGINAYGTEGAVNAPNLVLPDHIPEAQEALARPETEPVEPGPIADPRQPVNLAVVEDFVAVPQPGGIPTMPARTSTQGDAAVMPSEIVKKTIYLKNAKMNEPYIGLIDVPGIRGLRLVDDGGTGLKLDEQAGTLRGLLGASGDFVIRLQGLLAGRHCVVLANIAVIPDPRSLWVSKDSDHMAPFWKPDEDTGINRGDLLCVAASKRGRSHAREGLFRDDDFAIWTGGPGGWNIAVVADGAGSAKFSRRGSQIAVNTVIRELPRLLDEHLNGQIETLVADLRKGVGNARERIRAQLYRSLATAAFNAAKAINDEAAVVEERASAFSTTLVLSVARKGPYGWFIAGFSIGDGGAAIFDLSARKVVPLTLADSGEFAGQTRFLQKSEFAAGYEEVAKRLFFDVRGEFTAILVMTDGITDPKFPTDNAFESSDVWCSFWETDLSKAVLLTRNNPALERDLLTWLDFWSPGNHDDRTIAIMLP